MNSIFMTMGTYEKAALIRERDSLWVRKAYIRPDEGRRLDELIGLFGKPDDEEMHRKRGLPLPTIEPHLLEVGK